MIAGKQKQIPPNQTTIAGKQKTAARNQKVIASKQETIAGQQKTIPPNQTTIAGQTEDDPSQTEDDPSQTDLFVPRRREGAPAVAARRSAGSSGAGEKHGGSPLIAGCTLDEADAGRIIPAAAGRPRRKAPSGCSSLPTQQSYLCVNDDEPIAAAHA